MRKKTTTKKDSNFWEKLKKPFFCLAPMAGITDSVFRRTVLKLSEKTRPAVIYTEFVSVDGLCSQGKEKLLLDLKFDKKTERPVVAQFFGVDPEKFFVCAKLAKELGFDGVDINMGCPDKAVVRQGAGSALILKPSLAKEIIAAAKEGAAGLPVSVKTRIGYLKNQVEEWLPVLLSAGPAAIALHGRTKKHGYIGLADWQAIKVAVDLADKMPIADRPLIIGNGSLTSLAEALEKIEYSGADGAMFGRGVLSNPWLFSGRQTEEIAAGERAIALLNHLTLFKKEYGKIRPFCEIKKYFHPYLSSFSRAKDWRMKLMAAETIDEAIDILKKLIYNN